MGRAGPGRCPPAAGPNQPGHRAYRARSAARAIRLRAVAGARPGRRTARAPAARAHAARRWPARRSGSRSGRSCSSAQAAWALGPSSSARRHRYRRPTTGRAAARPAARRPAATTSGPVRGPPCAVAQPPPPASPGSVSPSLFSAPVPALLETGAGWGCPAGRAGDAAGGRATAAASRSAGRRRLAGGAGGGGLEAQPATPGKYSSGQACASLVLTCQFGARRVPA